ncbi:MAG: IS3 family transposase [Chthoniobacterales bacterium]
MRTEQSCYSTAEMCLALEVSRSGLYDHTYKNQSDRRQEDAVLAEQISLIFLQSRNTYGCRRIQQMLRRQGIQCGKNRICRLMEDQGLQAVQKRRFRPRTTQSRHAEPIAPNRLQELPEAPQRPNQVWTADLTYIPTQEEGWLYLAAEMDLCSKRIAGWNLDDSLAAPLAVEAFQRAVRSWSAPMLHHSDRGVQYAAQEFRNTLKIYNVAPSMSRKGCCYDNAAMESFFATLKTECFQNRIPKNRAQARAMLFDYIETFYNPQRLHSALGYLSPLEFEKLLNDELNLQN